MADENAHSQQAAHNHEFVDFLNVESTEYLDWVVTGAFYVAVHLIEEFLARHDSHPGSHDMRCNAMSSFTSLRPVFRDYCDLHYQSERSRYRCVRFDRNFVRADVLGKLTSIKTEIQNL